MNRFCRAIGLVLLAMLLFVAPSHALTLASNTSISFDNTNFDGLDIEVTNCTVTIDGPHNFSSLHVQNGGIITHTFSSNAVLQSVIHVSGEIQTLSVTNPATLNFSNVFLNTIVVADTNSSITYTQDVDYALSTLGNGFTQILLTTNSAIADGSAVSVSYDALRVVPAGVSLVVSNDVQIEAGGAIAANGIGYGGGLGAGAGRAAFTNFPFSFAAGGGGGYGGFGGSSSTAGAGGNCYGDTRFPADAGSGGGAGSGPGGAGGGLIQIIAGGLLRLDGQIAANGGAGTNAHSGGGSGGGIWLSAQNLSGTGLLQANGGAGEPTDGGGGGGGHIAINCLSNAFAGSIGAQGGSGATRGGAGTIFTTTNSLAQTGQLLVDNGGSRGTNTLITISGSYDLMVTGGAIAHGSNSWAFSSLVVGSNSLITHLPTQSLSLVVSGNATIQAGGGIVANAEGYAGGSGLGAGGFSLSAFGSAGGGAGYGGYGGANFTNAAGGLYYGSVAQPTDFGSGGGQGAGSFPGSRGGSGGGSIHLTVAGMLLVDGALTVDAANGIAQGSGGGSGGSLWLQAGQLSGSGIISANGGAGEMPLGGGGSGGRISISEGTNHFTGIISAHGGQGASTGGAGTIYSTVANAPFSQLLVNNGGIHGTNTPLPSPGNNLDLTISGGGSVDAAPVSFPSIHSLLILSNGWVTTTATSRQINLSVSGNVTVFSGGGFVLDGLVPAGTGGTGQGQSGVSPFPSGGGGGHGGYGGVSGFGAAGGNSYDSITAPTLAGSVGGNGTGNSPNNLGGAAGGALQLTVGGGMSFSGIISANGKPGVGQWSGGGSGGSVYITALNFEGSGIISADGGAGDPINGGGGAGGRISINYTSKNFSGSVSAHGGSGTNYGGAGTVYWKSASSSFGQVVLDNGGFPGTNTPLALSSSSDLTISGGAGIFVTTTLPTIGNLVIGSNSFLSFTSPFSPRTITVLSNVTIQAGGGINLDGQGSSQSGTATAISGSGGGYGGYGGNSATNSGGGNSYGSISSPIDLGGAGALRFASSKTAAAGGGALHLTIGGTLTLDGGITARGNGTPGSTSGGGAGGSLWIATGKILGSGLLSADGGAGDLAAGCGGGGGGRIALFFATNQFTGVISAHGGTGLNYGGAGTIYSLASNTFIPLIVVDNGNVRGTNTPLSVLPEQVNLTITGGGQAFALNLPTLIGNLLIGSNSFLIYSNLFGTRSATVTSNATIQAGGGFIMDGMGSAGGSGTAPGQTLNLTGGGGGHGGTGGNSASNALGGIVYDSISGPTGLGSGGGGTILFGSTSPGVGGGAFHLTVNGILALDGAISANGTAGTSSGSGGGSGGSIWLTLGKLSGAGSISANGGSGNLPFGGGGGGGRVAILYNTNQFSGSLFARGGPGANSGGAGTIYLASNKGIQGTNTLIIDNGGTRGATTPFSISGVNLTLGAGSAALVSNSVSFTGLSIASNSVLFSQRAIISVTGNATVQSGGGIVMDGLGSPAGQGPGAGAANFITPYGTTGGGGGYAGYGGNSSFGSAGGNSYGVFDSPTDIGSGGGSGNGTSTNNLGGAGGGSVQLTVTGTLACDGKISADGLPGNGQWSGGGSGGSVLLSAGKITGAGLISANGAPGDLPNGGGGGGGRIAVIFTTNTFSGTIIAHGGVGATGGGAGTIYTRSNSITGSTAQVTLDNAGLRGTNTPLPFASTYGLTVGGGAIGNPAANTTFSSLLINSNGWLSQLRNTNDITFTVSGNAIIRAGGGILANGLIGSLGTGAGGSLNTTSDAWTGGGGGYGGFGAQSVDGATGGNSFGSITQPASVGSAGGGFLASTFGAPGGGVVNLHVLNNLSVDGQISANGHDAIVEGAGGGSGGSVLLTVGSLSGSGVISANGGNGDVLQGGGGGGGRLAVYYSTNNFTGGISAYGGNGAYFGGAGTVYSKANSSSVSQLVIDNAGDVGTNTPLPSVPTADLFVTGGAVANPTAPLTLNSLLVDSQASMTHLPLSNLDLIVFGNAVIGTNGSVVANGKGYTALNAGPGAGQMPGNNAGSGGGSGGTGGASATGVPGGATYGSAQQPTDLGSSGGYNLAATGFASLSQGGGAVRLRVAGTLTVNGKITANGNDAVYDRSGGGAGGSVWLTASNFAGHGFVTANGGAGEPFDGGGGGGGRIAINSRGNTFSGPIVAFGGFGAAFGNNGSVVITNIPAPQVIAQVPFTVVSYSVSNVDLTFDSPMNPGSVSPSDIVLYTPIGSLPTSSITVTILGLSTFRFNFPPQTTVGYYEIDAGPDIQDFYGLSMADTYIGSFVIASPTISGRVTTTNGTAVAFVTLNAGPTLLPAVTDASGQYELEVPPGWTGTITPSKGNSLFIPAARVYSAVSTDLTNQNFITVSPALLTMHSQLQGANLNLNWFGINGVTYQTLYSTDLINWFPYGTPFIGTNGPVNLLAPVGSAPAAFFRFTTSY